RRPAQGTAELPIRLTAVTRRIRPRTRGPVPACPGETHMVPSKPKLVLYGLVILFCCLCAVPNLFHPTQLERWPDWLPTRQVPLGLDLRGGAHLVLEIDTVAVSREQLDQLAAGAADVLRDAGVEHAPARVTGDQ